MRMKTSDKIVMGLVSVAVLGFVIYSIRRQKTKEMLRKVSNEGYETAHDVLFPNKTDRLSNLRYGPVLPE
jgi:hypothetical protein